MAGIGKCAANIVVHLHACKDAAKFKVNIIACKDEFAMVANSIY